MKKKFVFTLIAYLFLFCKLYSQENVELWNGFCSGMSPNQVRSLIAQKITVTKIKESEDKYFMNGTQYIGGEYSPKFTRPYTKKIEIRTNAREFYQDDFFSDQIIFYFANNELYHVCVLYNLTGNEIYENLCNKYQTPYKTEERSFYNNYNDFYPSAYHYEYFWKKENFNVYFLNYAENYKTSFYYVHFFDSNYKERYDSEKNQKEENLKQQQEIENQENLKKMVF